MKTVGEILRQARAERGFTLEQVEKSTKIRKKFLIAIESDEYSSLPSQAYAKGFVKNYSEFLGLNSRNVMAFFRRQTMEVPKSKLLPKGVTEPLNESVLQLTPTRFVALLLVGLVGVFLVYFGLQYRRLQEPPTITIEAPAEGAVTNQTKIDVLGQTESDATVTVNGVSVLVRGDGKYFEQVHLTPGENTITVMATSRYGKSTTLTRSVVREE